MLALLCLGVLVFSYLVNTSLVDYFIIGLWLICFYLFFVVFVLDLLL